MQLLNHLIYLTILPNHKAKRAQQTICFNRTQAKHIMYLSLEEMPRVQTLNRRQISLEIRLPHQIISSTTSKAQAQQIFFQMLLKISNNLQIISLPHPNKPDKPNNPNLVNKQEEINSFPTNQYL